MCPQNNDNVWLKYSCRYETHLEPFWTCVRNIVKLLGPLSKCLKLSQVTTSATMQTHWLEAGRAPKTSLELCWTCVRTIVNLHRPLAGLLCGYETLLDTLGPVWSSFESVWASLRQCGTSEILPPSCSRPAL